MAPGGGATSDRHHDLLPDHRVPEGYLAVADSHASRRRDAAKMDCRIQILWVLHISLNSFGVPRSEFRVGGGNVEP